MYDANGRPIRGTNNVTDKTIAALVARGITFRALPPGEQPQGYPPKPAPSRQQVYNYPYGHRR